MSGPDPNPDEFAHIDAALQALFRIFKDPSFNSTSKESLVPLFTALDYVVATPLANIEWTENDVANPVDILNVLCGPKYAETVAAVIKSNILDVGDAFPTPIHPVMFYDHAAFGFNGGYHLRAQYLHPSGLGLVLQLGGTVHSTFRRPYLAWNDGGPDFPYWQMKGWRLESVFAGDSVTDGPEPKANHAAVQWLIDEQRADAVEAQAMIKRADDARREKEATDKIDK